MRSRSDDELYALQNRYLGPPGRTLLWQARYIAYAVWTGFFLVFLIVKQQLGLFPGFLGYLVVVVAAALATKATMKVVTPDRPAAQVLRMFFAELSAPRPTPAAPTVATPDPRHVHLSVARPTAERWQ